MVEQNKIALSLLFKQLKDTLASQELVLRKYKNHTVIEIWHCFHLRIEQDKIVYISAIDTLFTNLKWLYNYWISDFSIIDDVN